MRRVSPSRASLQSHRCSSFFLLITGPLLCLPGSFLCGYQFHIYPRGKIYPESYPQSQTSNQPFSSQLTAGHLRRPHRHGQGHRMKGRPNVGVREVSQHATRLCHSLSARPKSSCSFNSSLASSRLSFFLASSGQLHISNVAPLYSPGRK